MESLLEKRSRILLDVPCGKGPVMYLMDRDIRIANNYALSLASQRAHERGVPLLVLYYLIPGFLGGTYRQHLFKIQGLQEVEKNFKEHKVPFFIVSGDSAKSIETFVKKHDVGEIITDFSPLRIQQDVKRSLVRKLSVPIIEVDTHNMVPAWVVSQKAEVGARTLRPKLHKLLGEFPHARTALRAPQTQYPSEKIDWEKLLADSSIDASVSESHLTGGEKAGQEILSSFIFEHLSLYAHKRNDAMAGVVSKLSPYLHYGMISIYQIVRAVEEYTDTPLSKLLEARKNLAGAKNKHTPTLKESAGAFLEEVIVRKELSDNFCLYNPDTYDTAECFPKWAQTSLKEHEKDKRTYVYTRKEFEFAKTHDELWNAAQREMTQTGSMHGYMRMYWAKKILEWTPDATTAQGIAIYLNDKYELDGRDPNGYAGIAWSIGGVHDRPWFTRPIFGVIRYMARSGCESKFDVKAYIERFGGGTLSL